MIIAGVLSHACVLMPGNAMNLNNNIVTPVIRIRKCSYTAFLAFRVPGGHYFFLSCGKYDGHK